MPDLGQNADRFRTAWLMRKNGATFSAVGEALGVSSTRARQIVTRAKFRMTSATETYSGPVTDPIAYGVWHEFSAETEQEDEKRYQKFLTWARNQASEARKAHVEAHGAEDAENARLAAVARVPIQPYAYQRAGYASIEDFVQRSRQEYIRTQGPADAEKVRAAAIARVKQKREARSCLK